MNAELTPGLRGSPYQEIFGHIESMPQCQPIEAYSAYQNFLSAKKLDPSIYLSMAITSGGFARNENLGFREAMGMNADFGTQTSQLIADQLSRLDITPADIVLPSDLGKVEGWGQAEYLIFWAQVICGLDLKEAQSLDERLGQYDPGQHPGFSDINASMEEKWQAGKLLVDTLVSSLEDMQLGKALDGASLPKNMQAVVLILDAAKSIGVNTERYLCHSLGLGEYSLSLNTQSTSYLEEVSALKNMGADTLSIVEAGQPPIISGIVNFASQERLRELGFRFRKTGILMGTVERKATATVEATSYSSPTNEQTWHEYYQYN